MPTYKIQITERTLVERSDTITASSEWEARSLAIEYWFHPQDYFEELEKTFEYKIVMTEVDDDSA